MYEDFFGLKRKPFELVPNPDFLYMGVAHKKVLTYLNYAVQEGMGFLLLTGEVGSGKTTLIRDFVNKLEQRATLAKVFNTKVNFEQLISMINDDFGLETTGKDKVALLKDLYRFLADEHGKGRTPLLIIDEAQNLTADVLEEVRMLSNLETQETKLLQIILAGQPELAATLSLPELRQLRQRISIVCQLAPLTRQESEAYIFHRLAVAGNRDAVQILPEAMEGIFSYSNGIPRLLNIICNFLLLTAFTEGTKAIDRQMVDDIVKELRTETAGETSKEPTAGKKALLHALGAPVSVEERKVSAATVSDPKDAERKVLLLLKDMSLRLAALEKQQARLRAQDLDDVKQRLKVLECSLAQGEGRNKALVVPPLTANNEASNQPAAGPAPKQQKNDAPKKGLLERIVGTIS
jgi:general secretion pathway protein A